MGLGHTVGDTVTQTKVKDWIVTVTVRGRMREPSPRIALQKLKAAVKQAVKEAEVKKVVGSRIRLEWKP